MFLQPAPDASSLGAEHNPQRGRPVRLMQGDPAGGRRAGNPVAGLLGPFARLREIGHLRHRDVVLPSAGDAQDRLGHLHRVVPGQDHGESPQAGQRAQDSAQVLRIGDPVKEEQGGAVRLPEDPFQLRVPERLRLGEHPLGVDRPGEALKLHPGFKGDRPAGGAGRLHYLGGFNAFLEDDRADRLGADAQPFHHGPFAIEAHRRHPIRRLHGRYSNRFPRRH